MKKTKTNKKDTVNKDTVKEQKADPEKEINQFLSDLFSRLQIKAEVSIKREEENHFKVNIQSEDTGLLIGRHGETINSLQLVLGIMLYKKLGSWVRVLVDIGDYRKDREQSIKEMVERITAEVEEKNQPVVLPYLTPYERRIVHMMLADHQKVASESSGEGKDRYVTIKPRQTE